MCGESWVARQRPQRRRGRATVPPVDPGPPGSGSARPRQRRSRAAHTAHRNAPVIGPKRSLASSDSGLLAALGK